MLFCLRCDTSAVHFALSSIRSRRGLWFCGSCICAVLWFVVLRLALELMLLLIISH